METLNSIGEKPITAAMNEWDFIGQDTFMALGKSATSNKFKIWCGFEQMARLVLSNPHSS